MLLSESYKKRLQELVGVDKLQSDAIGYNVGKYIYHVTPIKNLNAIKKQGLKPQNGVTINGKDFTNRIYFATSLIAAYDIYVNFGSYKDDGEYVILKLDSSCLVNGYEKDPLFVHGIFVEYPIDKKYIVDTTKADDLFNKYDGDALDDLYLGESYKKRLQELAGLVNEELNTVSLRQAVDKKMFGPVYHGSTSENLDKIQQKGFEVFVGDARSVNTRHGYPEVSYHDGIPPPVHHLGYGIYFTTNKTIAKNFNNGTTKGLKQYYLDVPRMATINFGSPKNMMKWWIDNGYDPELAKTNRVEATKKLTDNLKSKYDAVWFKGKSMYRLLDGDQIVVFDTSRIHQIDSSLSGEKEIGSTIILTKDLLRKKFDYTDGVKYIGSEIEVPKGMVGIIKRKTPAPPMRDFWEKNGNAEPHWSGNSEFVYTVTFKRGGTHSNILDDMIAPYKK